MNSLYGLAGSFVGIFVPVYLLSRTLDPANVFWFYIVYSLGVLVFFFVADHIAGRIGLRKTVLIGFPFLFLYFFLLYTLDVYHTPLAIVALVNAIQAAFYWFPLHMWLAGVSKEKELGNELGKFFALSQAVGIVAPFIAGFVVFYFGFKALFLGASVLYLLSAIPIVSLPEVPFTRALLGSDLSRLFKEYRGYSFAEFFENIREDAEAIIWPVVVFLAFKDVLTIGYIGTLSGIGGALFTLAVGRTTDRMDKKKLMAAGALIAAAIWVLRLFVASQIAFYLITLVMSFFSVLILVPLNSVVYGVARREGPGRFILFREVIVTAARLVLYAIALLMLPNVTFSFLVGALACVGLFLASRRNFEAAPGR